MTRDATPVLCSSVEVIVESTHEEAAAAAAAILAEGIRGTDRRYTFGLGGGSTPVATYRALLGHDLDWEKVICWLPDERYVPPHHQDSNTLQARLELIDHVPATLLAPDTTIADPHHSAAAYEVALFDVLADRRPDVVLLGMGTDGHTASLFPDTAALEVDRSGYVANWVERLDCWRLTATTPMLRASRRILFLVTGDAKAAMIRRVVTDAEPLPARIVAEGGDEVRWVLDEAAASLL
jgi:6-phosphogluconolactonase